MKFFTTNNTILALGVAGAMALNTVDAQANTAATTTSVFQNRAGTPCHIVKTGEVRTVECYISGRWQLRQTAAQSALRKTAKEAHTAAFDAVFATFDPAA